MSRRQFVITIAMLWLAGTGLRLTILATPPVIPSIHTDLHLTATGVGILGGLPVVMFALAALPGSLLISRFGALRTLVTGLLLAAIGGALRGTSQTVATLYATTILMGFGVAIMQPSLPPLVRQWLPTRIGFGTAVYTNGLLVGEMVPVSLMIPFVLPLVGGSWRLGLAVWSLPVVAIAAALVLLTPHTNAHPAGTARPQWWPDWSNGLIWRLGLVFGSVNAMYFASNAFLPDYLNSQGRPDLISGALTGLNLGQIPASLLLLAVAGRLERKVWPYLVAGAGSLLSIIGLVFSASAWTMFWAGLLSFCGGGTVVLALAVPPLVCAPTDVARTTAAVFTTSYTCALLISVASGVAWDASGIPALAFVPILLCALVLIAVSPTIPFDPYPETPV